jgi:hypothetical protein
MLQETNLLPAIWRISGNLLSGNVVTNFSFHPPRVAVTDSLPFVRCSQLVLVSAYLFTELVRHPLPLNASDKTRQSSAQCLLVVCALWFIQILTQSWVINHTSSTDACTPSSCRHLKNWMTSFFFIDVSSWYSRLGFLFVDFSDTKVTFILIRLGFEVHLMYSFMWKSLLSRMMSGGICMCWRYEFISSRF